MEILSEPRRCRTLRNIHLENPKNWCLNGWTFGYFQPFFYVKIWFIYSCLGFQAGRKRFSKCSKIVANVSNAMGYKMLSLLNFHPFLEQPGPNLVRPELIVLKANKMLFTLVQNFCKVAEIRSLNGNSQFGCDQMRCKILVNSKAMSDSTTSPAAALSVSPRIRGLTLNSTPFVIESWFVHEGRVEVSQASTGFNLLPASISFPLKWR